MTSRWLASAVFAALLALTACADLERGPSAPTPDADAPEDDAGATDGAALSFAGAVRPLLEPCARCHVAGQQAGDTQLLFTGVVTAEYAAVVSFVDTTTPSSSRLLAKMRGQGHEGGSIYAADALEYQTVLHWIQQGARP
jgi:hypothetical protein